MEELNRRAIAALPVLAKRFLLSVIALAFAVGMYAESPQLF